MLCLQAVLTVIYLSSFVLSGILPKRQGELKNVLLLLLFN